MKYFFITEDNVKISYEIKGEGAPLLLIHGWGGDYSSFQLADKYIGQGVKIISYDQRGFGASGKPGRGYTVEQLARDLRQLIEHLELDGITLVGYSMGAYVLLEYLAQFGNKNIDRVCIVDLTPKIVNEDGWDLGARNGTFTREKGFSDLRLLCSDLSEYAVTMQAEHNLHDWNPNMVKIVEDAIAHNDPFAMSALWVSMISKDYRPLLPQVSVPAMVIYGENSTCLNAKGAQYYQDMIPDSRVVFFEKCTHFLVVENAEKFYRTLREFMPVG